VGKLSEGLQNFFGRCAPPRNSVYGMLPLLSCFIIKILNLQFYRLQLALNVNNLKDILDVDLLSWKDIMENITSDLRSGTYPINPLPSFSTSLYLSLPSLVYYPHVFKTRPIKPV
jgi:hypothetical protein